VRRKFVGRAPTRTSTVSPPATTPATAKLRSRTVAAPRTTTAVSVTRLRRRARQRYRYSLTSIDVMFASVAQPPEVERARDRKDRRTQRIVLGIGLLVLVLASVGAAIGLRIVIIAVTTFLN
jgi:hypothetical protein